MFTYLMYIDTFKLNESTLYASILKIEKIPYFQQDLQRLIRNLPWSFKSQFLKDFGIALRTHVLHNLGTLLGMKKDLAYTYKLSFLTSQEIGQVPN